MTIVFRNVDASPEDEVTTWPYEAITANLERGLVPDWQPLLAEIRRQPWGRVARDIEALLVYQPIPGAAALFTRAIASARDAADQQDRQEVAERIRAAVAASGLTAARMAELVGTSASRFSTYTSGKVTPSAALLVRIERIASLPPSTM